MNSTQIIKLRLAELKKMSIQLKQSTQNSQNVDYELVSDILQATKSSAQKVNQIKRVREKEGKGRMGYAGNVVALNNSNNVHVAMPYKALFPQTAQKNQQSYNTPSYKQSFYSQKQQQFSHQHPTPTTYSQYSLTKPQHPATSYSHYQDTLQNPFISHSNNQYTNPFYHPQQEFIGQLYPHNSNSDDDNYYPNIIQHPYSDSQVLKLREQNSNLQRTIITMRHQIIQLRQKVQRVTKQQQWKTSLPYFHLCEQITALYTRLTINEHDYEKIDYHNYQAQLTLQKLTIKKVSSTTTTTTNTTTTLPKQLHMTDLKQVCYIDSIVMHLLFGYDNSVGQEGKLQKRKVLQHRDDRSDNQFEENVFIRFNNEEQLHRWDLALYINFNLINSLKKDKLFSNYLKHSRSAQKSRNKSSQSKRLNDSLTKSKDQNDLIDDDDDQDLMKKLEERQKLYLQTKKLYSQRMIDKANDKKILKSSRANNNKLSKQQPSQEFSQTHPMDFQNENIVDQYQDQRLKFNYKFQNQTQNSSSKQTERKNNDSSVEMQRNETSGFYDFSNLPQSATKLDNKQRIQPVENVFIPPLNLTGKKIQKQISFSPQENNQSPLTTTKRKPPQQQKTTNDNTKKEPSSVSALKQQKQSRIPTIIDKFTSQGYDLTKYSKDGFNPHQKRFFLSDDLKRLFWQQQGGKNKKFIDLKSIKQIQSQKIGEGIRKHIKRPKKQQHCIISYVKDNKMKVIELGANEKVMVMFVEELKMLLEHLGIVKGKE